MQKGVIDGKPVEVITPEQYWAQPNAYLAGFVAIDRGNGLAYPIRSKTDTRPGFYPTPVLAKFKDPTEEEMPLYSKDQVIDFSKPKSVGDLIDKQQQLQQQERTILTNADNIFQPQIKPEDYPAMQALKTAVNLKNIDLDSYEYRFGANYNNDRRLFEKPSITLAKLTSICNHLDIEAVLTLQDTSDDVANPMKDKITVVLTSGGEDDT